MVVGGGVGGFSAATALRRRLGSEHRVVLVERTGRHVFTPSLLWLMVGRRRPADLVRDLSRLERRGIEVRRAEVLAVDAQRKVAETSAGALPYDFLVLAPGAELAPEAVPGLAGAAHSFYDLDGAVRLWGALRGFREGRLALVVAGLPYKCPAAPYEAALLIEDYLRRAGRRDRVELAVYTPEPFPLPTAGETLGRAVQRLLEERGIAFHPGRRLVAVDGEGRRLSFEDGSSADYDLLVAVPPHRPPALVAASGLGGPGGWLSADPLTLRAGHEGVYALGDAVALPLPGRYRPDVPLTLPRAGVFAHAQAEVAAANVAEEVEGRALRHTFSGFGFCFLEVGRGKAGAACGDFYATPAPAVRMFPPRRLWHLGKVVFERTWLAGLGDRPWADLALRWGLRLMASERLWNRF